VVLLNLVLLHLLLAIAKVHLELGDTPLERRNLRLSLLGEASQVLELAHNRECTYDGS